MIGIIGAMKIETETLSDLMTEKNVEIISSIESIMDLGYRVVLAHPEFYINYRKLDYIKRLKELGVILQLDAISVLKGKVSRKIYNFSKKLLKGNYIDVIASDNHCDSKRNYKIFYKSYKVIYKKCK